MEQLLISQQKLVISTNFIDSSPSSFSLPIFSGGDGSSWFHQCVRQFHLYDVPENNQVYRAWMTLAEEALHWFNECQKGRDSLVWVEFSLAILSHFPRSQSASSKGKGSSTTFLPSISLGPSPGIISGTEEQSKQATTLTSISTLELLVNAWNFALLFVQTFKSLVAHGDTCYKLKMYATLNKPSSKYDLAFNPACSLVETKEYAEQLLQQARRSNQQSLLDANWAEKDIEKGMVAKNEKWILASFIVQLLNDMSKLVESVKLEFHIHFKVLAKVLLVAYVGAIEAKLGCDKLKEIQPLKTVQFGFCFGFKGSGSVSYLICSCCDERSCNEGKKLHFHDDSNIIDRSSIAQPRKKCITEPAQTRIATTKSTKGTSRTNAKSIVGTSHTTSSRSTSTTTCLGQIIIADTSCPIDCLPPPPPSAPPTPHFEATIFSFTNPEHRLKYQRFRTLPFAPCHTIVWDNFHTKDGWAEEVTARLDRVSLTPLFCGHLCFYINPVKELLSTFALDKKKTSISEGNVTFRLGNKDYSLSFDQFSMDMGFYTTSYLVLDYHYFSSDRTIQANVAASKFWRVTAPTGGSYKASRSKANLMEDPIYRYLHLVFRGSITHWVNSTGLLNPKDSYIFQCMRDKKRLHLGQWVAHLFHNITTNKSKALMGDDHPSEPLKFYGVTSCLHFGIQDLLALRCEPKLANNTTGVDQEDSDDNEEDEDEGDSLNTDSELHPDRVLSLTDTPTTYVETRPSVGAGYTSNSRPLPRKRCRSEADHPDYREDLQHLHDDIVALVASQHAFHASMTKWQTRMVHRLTRLEAQHLHPLADSVRWQQDSKV
ncbi:hypothetical protein LINPERPRIM_LOCUS40929 [Linum perenne]